MTSGRIAAVITCRDLGRTLLEALESVERQTRPAAEIVVVDGGSIEIYTRQMLALLERDGTRVVVAGGPGASAARNCGARLTSAEYLVWLDADDTLEPGYFDAAGTRLDADPDLDFVSCAQRAFGAASYVWSPSRPTFVDAVSTGGVPHASTMVRRRLWERTGGFDESLLSFELYDFWATAIEQGFRGIILDQPLLNYRVRPGSGYRLSIQPETYLARYRHFYAKHRAPVERHGLELIQAKEAFLLSQLEYWHTLESRAKSLEAELAGLRHEITETAQRLESRGLSRVEWGDLRRVQPLSRSWGRDRGKPIDRYYIDGFLETHRSDVRGRVLEVRERTERFDAVPTASYDCIVLTQTLHLVDDIVAVLSECARILAPGGVLLATVPSVTRVEDEAGRDGDLWRLTEASVRKLFAEVFAIDAFDVTAYGNVMACTAFLHGLSAEEMTPADLDQVDARFPVVIAIRAVKSDVVRLKADPTKGHVGSAFRRTFPAAILAYHRVAGLTPDSHALCTPPDIFRNHMACIRRDFCPISLGELVRAAASGRIPERAVAVTLDDGYLDALTAASPVLSDLGVPATFFVNTDRLDEEHERWWDILERVLSRETVPAVLQLHIDEQALRMPTATVAERAQALKRLNEAAWPLDTAARAALVRDVLSWSGGNGFPRATHRVMTAGELCTLANRPGHFIGAHTVNHLALTTQPVETKRMEIAESKVTLERVLERPVHLFSYPYGDFDADMLAIAGKAGFRAAVTVQAGLVSAGTNRLLLPRYEITPRQHGGFALFLEKIFEGRHP
jgi:peptidoglycan/xylan/chitin deacetylase (PgdA/CDA1 family)/glycosyltransferase involved in cell wall biosynthesis